MRALLITVLVGGVPAQDPQGSVPLDASTFELWRDHLAPAPDELRWESIPWHPTFAEGLLAADSAGKPLLFWAMNGHPLGCT